ncbi:putative ankyrin repeat protein [Trichoderma lentiforme]|uniref:Ankyrin repeat protein n=1 Tax=Trichoderma lentiforme TaxID=1567552 RepID=A0A9P4X9S0_9HYPO|nr:putative ankyrin repeat protein [Trichoderma lentiforme]
MGLRDFFKRRKSKAARNVPSNETDTADSDGCQSRQPQAESSGLTDPPDGMNGLNKSPENFKGRLIQDTPIRELWNVAYEKLREEDGKLIEDYEAKLIGSVTTGLGETLDLKQDRREWMQAILSSKMEEVNNELDPGSFKSQAKDTMQLVLNIVNSAKDYIGSAANANPYTSIAWTGVSFLLPLLMNISEEETSLTKGLEYITSLIVQSRMREELYVKCYESGAHNHERFRQSHTQYKTALERLYTYILRFQATACCHYSKSSALRRGLDAVKWKDWAQLADEVREQERNFAAIEQMWRDFQRYEEHLTTINTFSEINAKLSALADDEFAGLLKWLCDVDPSSMYNAGLDRREAGTCEWLIRDSEEFKTWQTNDRSLLWLHGKAGSGKSILSSSVIKHLQDQYVSEPSIVVSYFYFSFSDPEKQKVDAMLASLTKQICSRQTQGSQLMKRLQQYKLNGQRPDTETLEAVLIASASEFSNLYVVIDALDECPLLNDQRGKLLKSLRRILSIAPNNFHFFFTSRRETDIDDKIRPILSLKNKDEIDLLARQQIINRDINHYIDSQLNGVEYKSWPESVKEETRELLVKKADCMFQYVQLQLEALRNLSSEPEVREALRNLPTGLDATYNRALESIPPNFKERVIHSLKWLALSKEVLFVEELAEIFTIRPHNNISFNEKERPFSPTAILKYFSGLIIAQEVDSSRRFQEGTQSTQIRLVHFSLKEYLISERIKQGPGRAFSFIEDDAQFSVVRSCLAYLNHLNHWVAGQTTEYPHDGTVIKSYPLATYAARYWMAHLEEIPRGSWSSDIERDAASALAVHSQSLYFLLLLLDTGRRPNETQYILKPYCYTAERGHLQLTKMLIYEKPDANKYITREELDEALQQMAYKGRTDAMQLFIEAGADVNAHCGEWGSALQAAAAGGHVDCLKLLVRSGAKVNSPSNNDTCLLTCTTKMNTESLQFLLDSGADINMQDKLHRTALHQAIRGYQDANFDLLLERGANVNTLTKLGTPLQVACGTQSPIPFYRKPKKIARYAKKLLESGADPNLRGGEGVTALQLACDSKDLFPNRHVAMEVLQLLVENGTVERGTIIQGFVVGADENRAAGIVWGKEWLTGGPPLLESAVEVVKLLLENGARIEEPLPLHMACIWRDKKRVRGLLDQGADVNAKSDSYGTPLHAILTYHVSNNGRIKRPIEPNRKKSLCEETIPIVQLLISKGARVNHIGGRYGTALQAACSNEALSVDITRCLLEHGADVNAGGGKYGTALVAACTSDREVDFIRLLIEHGADVNAEGGEYGTALVAACTSYREVDVVRLLIEHGADVNAEGGEYGTALAAACGRGALELVRLLLEHGANIHHRDYAAWIAAARRSLYDDGVIKILDLLFDQVSDKSHAGDELGTALNSMLENYPRREEDQRWHKRFRWLLEHGADINVKSGKYGFALQAACAGEAEFGTVEDINTNYGTTKFLLEQYPEINVNAQGGIFGSVLQTAAFYGQTGLVRLLLDRGADIDARGGKCGSALNAAIFRGYWDIVKILLQKGAIPDYRLRQQPDEEWLQQVRDKWSEEFAEFNRNYKRAREAGWRCAIARYRKFWEVESGSAVGTE